MVPNVAFTRAAARGGVQGWIGDPGGAETAGHVPGKEAEPMPHIDVEILTPFTAKYLEGRSLTPAERAEVLRLAQGFACKDSAAAANVSPETIRARRKRIYRKLDVPGSGELISELLALSLRMLAAGERIEPRPVVPAQPQDTAASSTPTLIAAR
ncbi:transcriptional regulator, LuxR family [Anaeromyxobacter dehalogenans 2CP-C]|uniref:Transcriptional regulator, LuxR family n=2 Tax=Anaeromyxobacter dehalogenans TaxID=161493 RepID=Q2IHT8_ANADE|nr:transcriptional regulator, LuxR family [Anaeromyxobacter dehalogenans 2CP-C]